jgi:uncharacterized protein with PQ loop repeat
LFLEGSTPVSALLVNLVGAAASTMSFVMMWPQARQIVRNRANPAALSGVSAATQVFAIFNSVLWLSYGFLTGAFWVGAPGLVNGPVAAVCVYLLWKARPAAVDVRPGPVGVLPG